MNTLAPCKSEGVNGVLALDKPTGPTSFDVVAQVRRAFRTKAVGHAGTLDPLATGVLVVMLGEATKLSEYLTSQQKAYLAEITFGRSTDTLDVTGATVDERPLDTNAIDPTALAKAVEEERSRQWQVPPEHSAIKVAGQRAYALARRGETVELAPRRVSVSELTIRAWNENSLTLEMQVSKGYYVRSLVRDLCARLGVPGCMSALRRTASGSFQIGACVPWPCPPGTELPPLMTVSDAARLALPWGVLTSDGVSRARQGKRLVETHFDSLPGAMVAAWLDSEHKLIALGEHVAPGVEQDAYFRVVRGFRAGLV